jgi:hypothetical protein
MPRPTPKSEQLITTDTPEWRDRLDAYAQEHDISRAEALRHFMRLGLASEPVAGGPG